MEINKKKLGNLTPAVSKTPEPIVTKFGMGDKVGDPYPYAKFYYDPKRGFCSLPNPVSARGGANKVTRLVLLANVNSSSCSLYVIVRPSVVCLSVVCL